MRASALLGMGIALLTMTSITHTAAQKTVKPPNKVPNTITVGTLLRFEQMVWMQNPQNFMHNGQLPHKLRDNIALFLLAQHQDWSLPWAQEIQQSGTLSSENVAKLIEYHAKKPIINADKLQELSATNK